MSTVTRLVDGGLVKVVAFRRGGDGLGHDVGTSRSSGWLGAIQVAGGDPGLRGFGGGESSWVTGSVGPGDWDLSASW